MRAGVIQVANSAGQMVPYNLNPTPVTVGGQTYQPAMCGGSLCDPRGIGISPAITKLWNMMPAPNDFTIVGDQYNVQGFIYPIKAPLVQDSEVMRIDHNFGAKQRFFGSYRHTVIQNASSTNIQMDPTGAGSLKITANRPQHPSLMVFGLTSTIRPNLMNDFRFSYLRNQWEYQTPGAPPQYAGLPAALEPGGEGSTANPFNSASNNLTPYTTVLTNNRSRIWDGQDKFFKDDIAWIKGKHSMEFGFSWLRNNILFARNDNPNCCTSWPVYNITSANTNFQGFPYPSTVPTNQQTNWNTYYSYVLGFVSQNQNNFTRDNNLALKPAGTDGVQPADHPLLHALRRGFLAHQAERHHHLRPQLHDPVSADAH